MEQALGKRSAPRVSGIDSLTAREMEVFRLIGSGLTTAQVAAQLHLSIHTIETYRLRIKSKLSLRTSGRTCQCFCSLDYRARVRA